MAYSDLTALSSLPKATLKVEGRTASHEGTNTTRIGLVNRSSALAFFLHLRVLKGSHGPELLPTFWTENYLALMPGESSEVTATYSTKDLGAAQPVVSAGRTGCFGSLSRLQASADANPLSGFSISFLNRGKAPQKSLR